MSTIIGLVSTFRLPLQKASKSPNGMRKRVRLDVEVEKVTEEVQKGRKNVSDWTLKQWECKQKSKRNEKTCQIGC